MKLGRIGIPGAGLDSFKYNLSDIYYNHNTSYRNAIIVLSLYAFVAYTHGTLIKNKTA